MRTNIISAVEARASRVSAKSLRDVARWNIAKALEIADNSSLWNEDEAFHHARYMEQARILKAVAKQL